MQVQKSELMATLFTTNPTLRPSVKNSKIIYFKNAFIIFGQSWSRHALRDMDINITIAIFIVIVILHHNNYKYSDLRCENLHVIKLIARFWLIKEIYIL